MIKCVRIHGYGGLEQLHYEDAPLPEPGAGELRVSVHAASVNPADWKVRRGLVQQFVPLSFPAIIGGDIAGVVDAVGDGVTAFRAGDEVFAMIGYVGAYSESVVVPATFVARKPPKLDFVQAASAPLAALTALQAVELGNVSNGQTVLIHAASGGVGSFAVQLAFWKRAHVIATASSANHDYLTGLGAERCIDYRAHNFEEEVSGADVVLDALGGDTPRRSLKVLKPGGVVVSIAEPPIVLAADSQGRTNLGVAVQPDGVKLAEIARLIELGILHIEIAAVFPLQDVAKAHALVESGHTRGKVVLQIR